MGVSSRRIASLPRAWWTSIQHRIVRIVPLYWFLTTAKLILVFLFADLALRSSLDFDYVAGSYLFFPVVDGAGHFRPLLPVGWTLTYEFLFYFLFATGLPAQVLAILGCLVASSIVGSVAYMIIERPITLSLKKRVIAPA